MYLGSGKFERLGKEMLKYHFLWLPLHVDTAPLGQFIVPGAVQPKGLSV